MISAIDRVNRPTSVTAMVRTASLLTLLVLTPVTAGRLLPKVSCPGFWHVVAIGEGSRSSETLSITDTIGQTVVGRMAPQSLGLIAGFQTGLGLQSVVPPILTDLVFKKVVFSNAGGTTNSETLSMVYTVGQTAIGPASATNSAIHGGFLAQASSSVGRPVCEDLDGDGLTNVIDVIILLQILVGKLQADAELLQLADVDSNGALNILDRISLLHHVASGSPTPSCNIA